MVYYSHSPNWYKIGFLAFLIVAGGLVFAIQKFQVYERERAMIYELDQLRTATKLYMIKKGKKPRDLVALIQAKDNFISTFEWSIKKDEQGNFIDPFGSLYLYDSSTGWARSSTSGYEDW